MRDFEKEFQEYWNNPLIVRPKFDYHNINHYEVRRAFLAACDKGQEEISKLREMLWYLHGCAVVSLYGDDGEMQCPTHMIDFKRDTVDVIRSKLDAKAMAVFKSMEGGKP